MSLKGILRLRINKPDLPKFTIKTDFEENKFLSIKVPPNFDKK